MNSFRRIFAFILPARKTAAIMGTFTGMVAELEQAAEKARVAATKASDKAEALYDGAVAKAEDARTLAADAHLKTLALIDEAEEAGMNKAEAMDGKWQDAVSEMDAATAAANQLKALFVTPEGS